MPNRYAKGAFPKNIINLHRRKINLERKKPQNKFATTIKFVLSVAHRRFIQSGNAISTEAQINRYFTAKGKPLVQESGNIQTTQPTAQVRWW